MIAPLTSQQRYLFRKRRKAQLDQLIRAVKFWRPNEVDLIFPFHDQSV